SGVYTLNIPTTNPTVRMKPAIDAWQVIDPSVNLTYLNAPGDGTLALGVRVTALGGGMFHYEYAFENIDCDRSVGSLRIPVPAGTIVTNVGFHDVDYHSGEPLAGTDWTAAVAATNVTWTTTGYDVDPMANALRWGTLYN